MADHTKLFLYNKDTNEIGYIKYLYTRNVSASGTTSWGGNGFELRPTFTPSPANMNFLSLEENSWCFVRTNFLNRLYSMYRPEVTSTSFTYPGFAYEADGKIYYNTLDSGSTYAYGSYQVVYTIKRKYFYNGNWVESSSEGQTISSGRWCSPTYASGQTLPYIRVSGELDVADADNLILEIRDEIERYSNYYINKYGGGGAPDCLPMSYVLGSSAQNPSFGELSIMLPYVNNYVSIGNPTSGPYPNFSGNAINWRVPMSPADASFTVLDYETGKNNLPAAVTSYINTYFSGALPTDVGELDPNDLYPTSIYTPGGTSTDPHNPYPGGSSGSNPSTNDPLNSGADTTSTSTPGTWVLPFDEVPDTPSTVHSVDLGLYNVYALSAAQVKELANYLFSGATELGENLVKLIWGSKRDVIISLYEFPLMVTTQGTDTIRFIFDTDLAGLFHGKQLTSEYIPIDFGTIQVDRYSGTFYDFEPYTTLTLYIPYIGYIDLKPTEVVGSTLSIRGYVHLTTGELNVNVRSSRTGILGSYSGTIGRMLPIADADATEIYSSIIKTAASLGAVALAGAGMATASRAAAGISAPNKQTVDSARDTYMQSVGAWGAATRGVRGLEASMLQAQGSYEKAQADYSEQSGKYNAAQSAVRANREDFHDSASDAISNSLDAVTTGFGVSRGTVMTSSNGRVSPQRCFLRIEVPHQNVSRQQKILGYPANTSDALNSDRLHGYTELRTIELSIPNATLTEIQELEDILRGGFYLP